jgi:hypothetical protein
MCGRPRALRVGFGVAERHIASFVLVLRVAGWLTLITDEGNVADVSFYGMYGGWEGSWRGWVTIFFARMADALQARLDALIGWGLRSR